MKRIRTIFCILLTVSIWAACKTTAKTPNDPPSVNNNLVGSWEGCDGRIIHFTKKENPTASSTSETSPRQQPVQKDSILGRYTKLGGLTRYQFTVDEIGYKLVEDRPGYYTGLVKWQDRSGKETWKAVSIHVEGDTYLDDNSDSCSKVIKRITSL